MSAPYQNLITIEPGKRGSRPCIRGMRITVYDVLSSLAAGMTVDEVLADFPYLTEEDIRACLSYAAERERQTVHNRPYSRTTCSTSKIQVTAPPT